MGPEALCFRVVRPSVRTCVCTCMRAQAEAYTGLPRLLVFILLAWKSWQEKKGWSKSVFPALYLLVSVKRTYHEAVEATNQSLVSGNSHLASAWRRSGTSYLKMLWMLRLWITSRTDWISSGEDMGIKSFGLTSPSSDKYKYKMHLCIVMSVLLLAASGSQQV